MTGVQTCALPICFPVTIHSQKIKQVLPAQSLGCVLELEGLSQRFKAMRQPEVYEQYAGVLEIGVNQYLLYGFYEQPIKPTWRLV